MRAISSQRTPSRQTENRRCAKHYLRRRRIPGYYDGLDGSWAASPCRLLHCEQVLSLLRNMIKFSLYMPLDIRFAASYPRIPANARFSCRFCLSLEHILGILVLRNRTQGTYPFLCHLFQHDSTEMILHNFLCLLPCGSCSLGSPGNVTPFMW